MRKSWKISRLVCFGIVAAMLLWIPRLGIPAEQLNGSKRGFVTGVSMKIEYLAHDRERNLKQLRAELLSLNWFFENRITEQDRAQRVNAIVFFETKQHLQASIASLLLDLDGFTANDKPNSIGNTIKEFLMEITAFGKQIR